MASCNDCIHNEICQKFGGPFNISDADTSCTNFKSRSRFVELPFQLGDDVYCTRMFKIHKKTVKKIELDDEGIAIITEDGYCIDSSICFRSQKEAEQALKEREA